MGVLFAHEADQRALARLASVSIPLGARVLQYVTLFQPPKTRLTAAKKIKLLLQLLPDLERKGITFKGRDWVVPLEAWAMAIDQMLASRDGGRLELPLKGHGYLYSVLSGMADKHEAGQEAEREEAQRHPPRRDTVVVRGQAVSIGQGLDQLFGGRDPELAKLDADRSAKAPAPQSVLEHLANLKKGIQK